ncbi:MAG TPA: flavin reductase family protein [Chitinophagaceae bacterium]|nr:flavin reductase family protein [Chitinophagaceae bacterium]
MKFKPSELKTAQFHQYLLSAIAPRPICFASTIDASGNVNLSPFSFFNVFGSKPPILIFSPARRVRDNTIKHTLENAIETKEVVINVVNYAIVQQMSLSSCEYPKGISEFEKSGLTPIASEIVKPFRVKESPVQFECKVLEVKETGSEGGAGNLIICEVLMMHINNDVLNENQQIDPHKIDLVARMGADYYCRASGNAVFEVAKPNLNLGIGIDALPEFIRQSKVLTGNQLGQLGNSTSIPQIDIHFKLKSTDYLEQLAQEYLDKNEVDHAWQVLLRIKAN